MISKFIFNKYCHVLNRENRAILDFCSLIISYILCFFFDIYSEILDITSVIVKRVSACKIIIIICEVVENCNDFINIRSNKLKFGSLPMIGLLIKKWITSTTDSSYVEV